jgi:hypothetical protein
MKSARIFCTSGVAGSGNRLTRSLGGALCSDHRDARGRPRVIQLGSKLFGAHHGVSTAVGRPNGDGVLRNMTSSSPPPENMQ